MIADIAFIVRLCSCFYRGHLIQEKQHCTSDIAQGERSPDFFFPQLWPSDFGIMLNSKLCPHHSMHYEIYFSVMTLPFGAM
jgi:hypothetical protein